MMSPTLVLTVVKTTGWEGWWIQGPVDAEVITLSQPAPNVDHLLAHLSAFWIDTHASLRIFSPTEELYPGQPLPAAGLRFVVVPVRREGWETLHQYPYSVLIGSTGTWPAHAY